MFGIMKSKRRTVEKTVEETKVYKLNMKRAPLYAHLTQFIDVSDKILIHYVEGSLSYNRDLVYPPYLCDPMESRYFGPQSFTVLSEDGKILLTKTIIAYFSIGDIEDHIVERSLTDGEAAALKDHIVP